MKYKDDFDEAWDSMSHTSSEYRQEITDLRHRMLEYRKEIESLQAQLHAVNVDWMKAQDEIQTLRERIRNLRDS
ncbi:MAG: hypothetical protein EBZ75_14155 [Oxalobacteraceae bacterium]|nr:hypothetical protein [Oxalobacteraceae bacterium]